MTSAVFTVERLPVMIAARMAQAHNRARSGMGQALMNSVDRDVREKGGLGRNAARRQSAR